MPGSINNTVSNAFWLDNHDIQKYIFNRNGQI